MVNQYTTADKKKSLGNAWGLAIVYFVVGFAFFLAEVILYGWTLFVVLPTIVGLSAGLLPVKKYSIIGTITGLLAFLVLLLLGHYEGFACLVYTIPIALGAIAIGMLIAAIIKRRFKRKSNTLKFFIIPIFLFAGSGVMEKIFQDSGTLNTVSTSMYLNYPPDVVWDHIKAVDTLDTDKPFWLKVGLPVPEKCILEEERVGAKRICYFQGGQIEEEVTEIKKPSILRMKVTRYRLPGMQWLHFKDAIYTFSAKDSGTVITRTTTYISSLNPRFYWRLCENSAIESEHEYVLNDLKRRLRLLKK